MTGPLSVDRWVVLSQTLCLEPDECSTVARVVELAADVLPCEFVDMLSTSPSGAAVVVASTDELRSGRLTQLSTDQQDDPALLCCPISCSTVSVDPSRPATRSDEAGGPGTVPARPPSPTDSPAAQSSRYLLRLLSVGGVRWSEPDVQVAKAFADVAATAIDRAALRRLAENLVLGLESNRTIGTAVGILMAHRRAPYDQAFGMLKACSQDTNRKLREVALDVVMTGALPGHIDRGVA